MESISRRHIKVGLGILFLLFLSLWYSGTLLEVGILSCFPPPNIAVDGVIVAKGFVWHDLDLDGEIDNDEPPIRGVTVEIYFEKSRTDSQGIAEVTEFMPGCSCNCWESENISIEVPDGYFPTTPVSYELTGKDMIYEFGLRSVSSEE